MGRIWFLSRRPGHRWALPDPVALPAIAPAAVGRAHSLGLVGRARLVHQLELRSEAVGAGVLQQAAHGVGVQVPDQLADPPDLGRQCRLQALP